MKKLIALFYIFLLACDTGNLSVVSDLPNSLKEASGLETSANSNLLWMINDSGNKSILYGLDSLGSIKKQIKIDAKNRDWEDLASDKKGNIYIGDFGNNLNQRKKLSILKVLKDSLNSDKKIDVEKITFYYPEQTEFPPKNKDMHFDCESLIFYNDSLFLFTKSRSKKDFGRTNLYKIPAEKGHHEAEYISTFNTCTNYGCWVTSADINDSENSIVLLTENSAWVFTDFKSSDFFKGNVTQYSFEHYSQKESAIFKNDSTLYITDERNGPKGGNLYEFSIH